MEHPAERPEAVPKEASPILPTLLTLGNAMCGFAAVVCLTGGAASDLTSAMIVAACLIYLAMIFDTFDGLAARMMNQSGPFGAHLDSLSDAISFGVAPALLMAQFSARYGHSPYLTWPIAGAYVACAIMRLARFNAQIGTASRSGHSFCGLPSPAAAGTVAAFPLLASATPAWGNVSLAAFTGRLGVWLDTVAQGMPLVAAVVAALRRGQARGLQR